MPEDIRNFDIRVSELERRVEELSRQKEQQIQYPLDEESLRVLSSYFLRLVDNAVILSGAGDNAFVFFFAEQKNLPRSPEASNTLSQVVGNGLGRVEMAQQSLIPYIASASADTLTIAIKGHINVANDTRLVLFTSDTMPGGLSGQGLTTYYVVNTNGQSFQVSATSGGAAINITSAGTGRQFFQRLD